MDRERASQRAGIELQLTAKPYNLVLPIADATLAAFADDYLEERGLDPKVAEANFWYPSSEAGDDRPRIVIPASATPPNVYWQARAIDGDDEPRYQSPTAPRGDACILVWPKVLTRPHVVVVEGPLDALAAAEEGYVGVATMGTSTESQLNYIMKAFPKGLATVVMDLDYPKLMLDVVYGLVRREWKCRVRNPYPAKDLAAMSSARRTRFLED